MLQATYITIASQLFTVCCQGLPEDGLLAAFIVTLANAAPPAGAAMLASSQAGTNGSFQANTTDMRTSCSRKPVNGFAYMPAHGSSRVDVAPTQLQALRLTEGAGRGLANSSLVGIASMGIRLRQLALVDLQRVTRDHLAAALAQLPMLQVGSRFGLVEEL